MGGWIDPLGVHLLTTAILRERERIVILADEANRYPKSRRLARYRARIEQLSRVQAALQAVTRPGAELQSYKDLVQTGSEERRALLGKWFDAG